MPADRAECPPRVFALQTVPSFVAALPIWTAYVQATSDVRGRARRLAAFDHAAGLQERGASPRLQLLKGRVEFIEGAERYVPWRHLVIRLYTHAHPCQSCALTLEIGKRTARVAQGRRLLRRRLSFSSREGELGYRGRDELACPPTVIVLGRSARSQGAGTNPTQRTSWLQTVYKLANF